MEEGAPTWLQNVLSSPWSEKTGDLPHFFPPLSVCAHARSFSCVRLCNAVDCSPPGPSVHVIILARILECVVISFHRFCSQPRNWTCVSWIARRLFTTEPPGKPLPLPGNCRLDWLRQPSPTQNLRGFQAPAAAREVLTLEAGVLASLISCLSFGTLTCSLFLTCFLNILMSPHLGIQEEYLVTAGGVWCWFQIPPPSPRRLGFPDSSFGKESACNADNSFSKESACNRETRVRSLVWEDHLEKG